MRIIAIALTWYDTWQTWRNQKHRSGWDNPVTGTDLLASMAAASRRRKDPLP